MRLFTAVATLVVVVAGAGLYAQYPTGTMGATMATPAHVVYTPADASWSPAPPGLPEGAEVSVIEGDPMRTGMFTLQLKMPDGYKVAPHWHPTDERLTIVQGTILMGMGDQWSEDSMKTLAPGSFVMLPKHNPHYVVAQGETIVQVQAEGPFALTYINPSDDPRRKQ